MDFVKRINAIQRTFLDDRQKALLVLGRENVFYLTNFWGSFSLLILLKNKVYLLVDGRYYERAKKSSFFCEVILFEDFGRAINEILVSHKIWTLFYEAEDVTVAFVSALKKKIKGAKLVPSPQSIIRELRVVKDRDEIRIMKEGAKRSRNIIDKFLNEYVKVGVTEKFLAAQLEFMIKSDADGISFDTIVAAGKNSSLPHAVPTNKKICPKDIVLIDYGVRWKGYCTDHTKTTILGVNKLEKYYNVIKEAIEIGLTYVKPNVPIKLVDEKIRVFFQNKGLLKHFLHSSGHGIGLDVHEKPTLSYKTEGVFKEGMVFTIEPGLYFEGIGGLRIEEMFCVTKKGYELL